jgi:predicted LPLAT superfamily acyltransferase
VQGTKQERIQALADAYARRLEEVVRLYPDQWYNFYDFWK